MFYDVASQFMLGDSLLIAPKVTKPTAQLSQLEMTEVSYALPEGYYWYSLDSKLKNTVTGSW
jgi:alpha-glucosidase (family GH31 glycosyl hydrolase)